MGIYTIYRVKNLINGKSYIGFTSHLLEQRKAGHIRTSKRSRLQFHQALQKYGPENFTWSILYQGDDFVYTQKIMEPFFISAFDTLYDGYNLTAGGDNPPGMKNRTHSEETKQRMSEIAKKRGISREQHRRMIESRNNKSDEHKQSYRKKISEKLKGRPAHSVSILNRTITSKRMSKPCIVKGIQFSSRKEAAQYFGVNRKVIYGWLKSLS